MRTYAILALAAAIGFSAVSAQDLYDGDYPSACESSCGLVNAAGDSCDEQNDEDDAEVQCQCTAQNMNNLIPECAACIQSNGGDSDDLQDINDLIAACGFAAVTPTSSASQASVTVYTTTRTSTDDDGNIETDEDEVTSTIGVAAPATTVYTTTSTGTDDDGNAETDVDEVTSTLSGGASPQTTVVTSTNDSGAATTMTTTNAGQTTAAGGAAALSSSQPGLAAATALPMLGAGAGALMAVIAAL